MAPKDEKNEIKIPDAEPTPKPPEGYTEADWMDLSETEREGILDSLKNPEPSEEEGEEQVSEEALAEIVGEGKEDKEKEEAEKPVTEATSPKATEAPPASETVPLEEKKPEIPISERMTDEDLRTFRAIVRAEEIVVNLKKPPEIQAKLVEINKKYDNGDLTMDQRDEQREEILEQWRDGREVVREQIRDEKIWEKEQAHFLNNRSEYLGELGPDGKFIPTVKSTALFGALSEQIRTMDQDAKFQNLSGMDLLIMADRKVKEALGMIEKPSEKPKEEKAKSEVKDKVKPPTKIPEVKTLSDTPMTTPNLAEDAFAQIDRLSGEAYETALERMTPDQRKRYEEDLRPRLR